jgi:ParB/RepB/Spo0J family partition protein
MRRVFEPTALRDLADSMRREGLLQPITVRPVGDAWELIAGERRWRAAQLLGWEAIDARVLHANDEAAAVKGLIENLQRADLSVMEEAQSYRQLVQPPYLMSIDSIAERVGRSSTCISRALALLELPQEIQTILARGGLSETHTRALRRLPQRAAQVAFAQRADREGWTVKETERRVDAWLQEQGHLIERRTAPRRAEESSDPLGHLWTGARASLNGHPARFDVRYQGKNRWTVNVRAEGSESQEHLAELFHHIASVLRRSKKQIAKVLKPRAKKR